MVVFVQRSMSLAVRKEVSETKCYLSTTIERPTYLSTLTQAKNHNFNIPLIFNIYNIMIVMQK